MKLDMKPHALLSLDNSVEVPLCRDHVPYDSFPGCWDDLKVVSRDDENSSSCTQPSNVTSRGFKSPPHIGERKIRKLLASKYWKMAPKLKDEDISNSDGEMKPLHLKRKNSYTRQRSQRNSLFKKRELFDESSILTFDGGMSNEGISNSHIIRLAG
ncbi:telomere repeat-binding protein 4-like [Telopea speciosissima]|uniref:telomere repeat-binding protein 4-like n=1 Tax=Telopea speciosissima TaxID=54955 RepID=UPI001CC7D518|nr:telomere repeat-binding protein 4-like [Telopea speciosissima]